MNKLLIHRDGRLIAAHDFLSLSRIREQEEESSNCFGGLSVGSVPLRLLLSAATSRDTHVTFHSTDGYSTTLTDIDEYRLVYKLGVLPLPKRFGGPYRLVRLGDHPQSCLKYVDSIELGAQANEDTLPIAL